MEHYYNLLIIIILTGVLGGVINFLQLFEKSPEKPYKFLLLKSIVISIGAALLIPLFLETISSNLIDEQNIKNYFVFAGFCLVASIFSKRFIETMGQKVLEKAEKAYEIAKESKEVSENTRQVVTATKERIEDVKLSIDIQNTPNNVSYTGEDAITELMDYVRSYIERTSIPDFNRRIKTKAELGRKMGEIILRNHLQKRELLNLDSAEGMLLAIAYSVQLKPEKDDIDILLEVSGKAQQLFTKYSILVAFDTLARNNFISSEKIDMVETVISMYRKGADNSLLNKIKDSSELLTILKRK